MSSDPQNLLRKQKTLARFAALALTSEDLDDILNEACRLVGEGLGTDLAKVMELVADGNTLLVRAGVGWKPGVVGQETVLVSEDTSEGFALTAGEPVISPDIAAEERFRFANFLIENGVKAIVNVPVHGVNGRPRFGILQVDSREPRQFNDDDIAFISNYASLIAAAVDRLRAVNELRSGEERLRASEARLARLLATSPAGLLELDSTGSFTYANPAAEHILGAGAGELVGRRFDDPAWHVSASDSDPDRIPTERLPGSWALRGEKVQNYEHAVTTIDGRRATLLVDVVPVRDEAADENGAAPIVGALAAFQDVTSRQAQAKALQESEARFRSFVEQASDVLWIVDAEAGRLEYLSPSYEKIWGEPRDHVMRDMSRWLERVHPDDRERAMTALPRALAGETSAIEYRVVQPDGGVRWILDTGFPIPDANGRVLRVGGIAQDVTERKRAEATLQETNASLEARVAERTAELLTAEAALRQSQKMEAVGQLTGGIAHDFNNMLQGISASLELLQRRIAQGQAEQAVHFADAARKTVERAAALTQRLLAFARRQVLQPIAVEPDGLIAGMAGLVRGTVEPEVKLELDLRDGTWTVLCDPSQLESALLNLAINARDAMPLGGTLTISTKDVRLTNAELLGNDGAQPGEYVEISVSDTGTGMDQATRDRAFEPFFTTKPIGQGTGLGLSQLHGFARQSGGAVRLESAPGQGTTVRIYLPRHTEVPWEGMDEPASSPTTASSAGETVLLVEDEAEIRSMVAEALREKGYRVLEMADGVAAMQALYGSQGASVDVLVTDVGLPNGLNGRQLAEVARERRPGIPVLFITGYAGSALDNQLASGMAVIAKPFALSTLIGRLHELVNTATSDRSAPK